MATANGVPAQIGKYEVLGVIGRGGMGVVYSARDPFIDRIVAIKTIHTASGDSEAEDDQAGRLRMEARSAGKLHHPNIVTIFDFGEMGDLSYIVMEYVEGINLSRVVEKRRAIPLPAKLDVLIQVARGLAYAHECGVVHRDMKPSNVCVTLKGVAKILDFGLARFDNTKMTKTGYLSGTIAYMSPERFSGETGPRDDIFALGAVAYEFLAYRRAFPGDTTPEIISKILGGPMPPALSELTGYPRGLDEIILRALDRDPETRYATAKDFANALEGFTRSPEYVEFIADGTLAPQQAVDWTDDSIHASRNPYSSEKSLPSVPIGKAPTLQVASDHVAPLHTEVVVPPGEPTLLNTKRAATRPAVTTESAPSVAPSPDRRPRSNAASIAIGIAVVAIALAGVLSFRKNTPEPIAVAPAPLTATTVTTAPAPPIAITDTASRSTEVRLATATTLANLVAQRQLTGQQRSRFAEANKRLDRARTLIASREFAAGAALVEDATDTFRDLLASSGPPAQQTASASAQVPSKTKTPPRKSEPEPSVAPAVVAVPPPPQPVPLVQVPAPRTEPAAQTTRPTRAELEREINAFVREMASAYQSKDVSFFRSRALNYSDQLGTAIRNSPSMRVDIAVQNIQFSDDAHANVRVKRTDTFAEARLPPGVQSLIYELRRTADGWQIVRFGRG